MERVSTVQINVDLSACVGAGQCALVAGALFDQDDDGIVILLNGAPTAGEEAEARRAAALCPARAIAISE